ncbi:hypothetical protein GCM10007924_10090 [Sneathiella chinensis]|uniref:GGDEF-domain containing protein n=2 Tax=Sneathiella chinensis TaxID=349750 RepID=A0ABQ5U224_9PROT|nr:hypothetical protein GCM10007924_10090 [Sneathiella chinensis]
MQTMNLPVKRSAGTLNTQITQDLNQGQYNLLLIDHDLGHDTVLKILETTTQIPPYATAVVIDGPIEMMNLGATDCVPAPEFSLSRVGSAVINGNRWKDLQLHLNGSDNHLLAKDPLTSLPGRTRFKKLLEQSTRKAREDDTYISLITLDLDSFKALNESKGHAYGDLILKTVAERLTQFVPEHSIVGRLGDDEFAVIIQGAGLARVSDTTTAARLSHELRQPYFLDGQSTTLSATMGIAKLEEHDTPDSLLHKAMSALYSAKRDKNRFMVYTQQEDTERRQQLRLAQELPDAIDNNQLRLHFQPMIRMHDSTVIGAEALVRWQHPQKGLLFPDSFIPLAEGAGSIEPLTRWVLDAAIRQGSKWLSSGHKLNVSVNISALILHNPIFPDIVNRLLEQSRFPAERLKLEITESAIISDVVRATDVVTRLHELGVKVSIDDFGTGYTSLAYIRKLPVDEIKIDKSFVLNMNTVSDDAVIVRTLLELARNLDLSVVAEGVEDRETWYMLAGLGCHVAQGYYMSRPIDVEAFDSWLTTSPWAAAR